MDHVKQAEDFLRKAETGLRELLSAAASAGDYAGVVQIATWARTLGDMLQDEQRGETIAVRNRASSTPAASTRAASAQRAKSKRAAAGYPKFCRQGDQLVRIAWSKREKKEYRHKAPRAVLQAVVTAMSELGRDGRVFSTEDFMPLRDAEGAEVPSYQAYVGIAFLKHTSLIDQHGRQGYSVPKLAEFKDAVDSLWQKLPTQ